MPVILSRAGFRAALLAVGLAIAGLLWLVLSSGLGLTSNDAPAPPGIVISLNDRGEALIGDVKATNQDELLELLKPYAIAVPQRAFVVSADAEVAYEKVDWVRYALQRAGIVIVYFTTVPQQTEILELEFPPAAPLPDPRTQSANLRIAPGPIYYWNDEVVPDRKELTVKFKTLGAEVTTLGSTTGYGLPWLRLYLSGALSYKSVIEVESEAKSLGILLIFPELDNKKLAE